MTAHAPDDDGDAVAAGAGEGMSATIVDVATLDLARALRGDGRVDEALALLDLALAAPGMQVALTADHAEAIGWLRLERGALHLERAALTDADGDLGAALGFFERGQRTAGAATASLLLGDLACAAGAEAAAVGWWRGAIALADACGATPVAARALISLLQVAGETPALAVGLGLGGGAPSDADGEGPLEAAAQLRLAASPAHALGDAAGAATDATPEAAETARSQARAADQQQTAMVTLALWRMRRELRGGQLGAVRLGLPAIIEAAAALQEPGLVVQALRLDAAVGRREGDPRAAVASLRRADSLCQRHGMQLLGWSVRIELTLALIDDEQWEEALALAAEEPPAAVAALPALHAARLEAFAALSLRTFALGPGLHASRQAVALRSALADGAGAAAGGAPARVATGPFAPAVEALQRSALLAAQIALAAGEPGSAEAHLDAAFGPDRMSATGLALVPGPAVVDAGAAVRGAVSAASASREPVHATLALHATLLREDIAAAREGLGLEPGIAWQARRQRLEAARAAATAPTAGAPIGLEIALELAIARLELRRQAEAETRDAWLEASDAAVARAHAALDISSRSPLLRHRAQVHVALVEALAASPEPARAVAEAAQALPLTQRAAAPESTARCLLGLGQALSRLGRWDEATLSLRQASAAADDVGPSVGRVAVQAMMAEADLLRQSGQVARAQERLDAALQRAQALGDPRLTWLAARAAAVADPTLAGRRTRLMRVSATAPASASDALQLAIDHLRLRADTAIAGGPTPEARAALASVANEVAALQALAKTPFAPALRLDAALLRVECMARSGPPSLALEEALCAETLARTRGGPALGAWLLLVGQLEPRVTPDDAEVGARAGARLAEALAIAGRSGGPAVEVVRRVIEGF